MVTPLKLKTMVVQYTNRVSVFNGTEMKKKNIKRVWCSGCINQRPPVIKKADYLVPLRTGFYSLCDNGFEIDERVIGVCKECLGDKNKFQRDNKIHVDIDNPNLVNNLI
mgnify:FL=1